MTLSDVQGRSHILQDFSNAIFRTGVQQLTRRFQLAWRVARSLRDSWASWFLYSLHRLHVHNEVIEVFCVLRQECELAQSQSQIYYIDGNAYPKAVGYDGRGTEINDEAVRAGFGLTTGVHDDAEIGGLSVEVRRSASVVAFATQSTRAGPARRRALCTAAGPYSIPIRRVTAIDQQFTATTDCCRLT